MNLISVLKKTECNSNFFVYIIIIMSKKFLKKWCKIHHKKYVKTLNCGPSFIMTSGIPKFLIPGIGIQFRHGRNTIKLNDGVDFSTSILTVFVQVNAFLCANNHIWQ